MEETATNIGYMLQKDHLFEWRTIYSNVLLGLEIQKKKSEENIERAQHLLSDYGLDKFKNSRPSQLSGGMRQRAALIRTLALDPELLLLDEHTAALDPGTADKVLKLTREIVEGEGITCLMITHNMKNALELGNRTLMMDSGHIVLDVQGEERAGMTVNDLLERFRAEGWTFVVDTRHLAELGRKYRVSCTGATEPGEKRIYVASPSAVLHEFGHFLDYVLDYPSKSEGF